VETRHGIGTFVLPPAPPMMGIDPGTVVTVRDVIALLELRIGLETEAAGLAAVRRTEPQLAEIRGALAALLQAARRGEDAVEFDQRFHLAIAQASGNPYFHAILQHLGANIIPRADAESARAAMRLHIGNSRERLRKAQEALEAAQGMGIEPT
jgi:DNA-binding FadR family transcriptional regulator